MTKKISDGHGELTICLWDISDGCLAIIYVLLLIWCIRLIYEHRNSWTSGQAHGLIWYLVCTTLLCIFRSIGFSMVQFADTECDHRYKSWQWEVDGSSDGTKFFDFCLIVLSTASSALFFTSYTYFAHSLAKVLDMLTSDNIHHSSKSETRFLIVLLGLNICVWLSIGIIIIIIIIIMLSSLYITIIITNIIITTIIITTIIIIMTIIITIIITTIIITNVIIIIIKSHYGYQHYLIFQ